MSGHTSETIVPLIAPTLDAFIAKAEPTCRKLAETIYEELLYSVQDYLRSNAEWNIGSELDRCRKTELENLHLRERNIALLAALEKIEGHETERPCWTAEESYMWTLDEVQRIASDARATGAA